MKRKVININRMMIQRNLRLLLLPQILPKSIQGKKIFTRNHNLLQDEKKSKNMEIEKKELNVPESLQPSIMSKNTNADDLLGKIVGDD